jgi:hypothetical protein
VHNRTRRPPVLVSQQDDDRRLAVDLARCHSPWNRPTLIATEIRRVDEAACEAIRHAQAGGGGDQFTKSIPVMLIESIDVEM